MNLFVSARKYSFTFSFKIYVELNCCLKFNFSRNKIFTSSSIGEKENG